MVFSRYKPKLDQVNGLLNSSLEGEPEKLYKAARHLIRAGGKRVRPLMCILSSDAVGGALNDVLATACAVEFIHSFTLIHDDIMDDDFLRRGRKSVHAAYGVNTAILAGDLLYSKAFELCDGKVAHLLAKASAMVCEGQEMDMSFEEGLDVSQEEYLVMIEKKTAALLEVSCRAGAYLGGASKNQMQGLSDYGLNIGMAFQIKDDLLEITGDDEKLGKPSGSDIAEGKKNLLAVRALKCVDGSKKKRLTELLAKEDNTFGEIDEVKKIFEEVGAVDYCKTKMNEYYQKSVDSLDILDDSKAKNHLLEIADFITSREF
ncbi:MAG: serralysin [Candidatus Altiarchaeales archaeon ex4484_96]|nr:MAG: serralysin [Candidatus Altiarchaeales archaeon ex4484_96]